MGNERGREGIMDERESVDKMERNTGGLWMDRKEKAIEGQGYGRVKDITCQGKG